MTMHIKAYITTELFDRDGKLLWRRRRRSRSFVKAFLALLLTQMNSEVNTEGVADTGGTERTIVDNVLSFRAIAGAGTTDVGIVVGTGQTAVNASDYALGTLIAHGITAGKLSYSAQFHGSLSVADPNVSFTEYRDLTNSSPGTITVWEEALYVAGYDSGGATRYFCAIRDVESSGIAVAVGQNLRVTYTIQTST